MFFHQFKNELLKLFAKKRTYIGFAMLILAQLLIVSLLRFSKPAHQGLRHTIERSGLDAGKYVSMLTVATFMVLVLAYSLLPLYVALVGGDMVSKEAEDGTLRMVLSRPVTRVRLLCLKWIAGVCFPSCWWRRLRPAASCSAVPRFRSPADSSRNCRNKLRAFSIFPTPCRDSCSHISSWSPRPSPS